MNKASTLIVSAWLTATLSILFGFNNCSETRFTQISEPEKVMVEELSLNGGILINRGDEYTNQKSVELSFLSEDSQQMYVTNDPLCESGGQWEDTKPQKMWILQGNNSEVSVYAKFKDSDGTISPCASDSITHDDQNPSLHFTAHPKAHVTSSAVSHTVDGSDSGSGILGFECTQVNKGVFSNCQNIIQNTTAEGTFMIQVRAVDKAGNKSDPIANQWTADWTPPSVNIYQAPPQLTSSKTAIIRFQGTDSLSGLAGFECRPPNSSQGTPCNSGEMTLSGLVDGAYTFSVRSIDNAGNASNWVAHQWQIDSSAPAVQIDSHPNPYDKEPKAIFTFSGTDTDGSVISKFRCRIDGGAFADCNSGIEYTLAEGSHSFDVVAMDATGNPSAPASYSWMIDRTAPTLQWTVIPATYSSINNVPLAAQATDAGSGIESYTCQVNGSNVTCPGGAFTSGTLALGPQVAMVLAMDRAGNVSSPLNHNWIFDNEKPTVTITQGPPPMGSSTSATFTFVGQDNLSPIAGYLCQRENLAYQACSSPTSYTNEDYGVHGINVIAVDQAGNKSDPAFRTWIVDNIGPQIVIHNRPLDHIAGTDDIIEFNVSDEYSGVASVMCGLEGNLASCSEAVTLNLGTLAEGSYKFVIQATDGLGNTSINDSTLWTVTSRLTQAYTIPVRVTEGSTSADILFVVDNSGSMKDEQQELVNRIAGFMNLVQGLDFRIAVTSTDKTSTTPDQNNIQQNFTRGRLRLLNNNRYFVDSTDSNAQQILEDGLYMGDKGDGDEVGIRNTYSFLTRVASGDPNESSFFRQDATFSVVVLSDENESSTGSSNFNSQPDNLLSYVTTTYPDKIFTFHSIISEGVCTTSSQPNLPHYDGTFYKRLSQLTNGVVGDICASNYTNQLSAIGSTVAVSIRSIDLSCDPVDMDNDGLPDVILADSSGNNVINISYTVTGNRVQYASPLPVGNWVASYHCYK